METGQCRLDISIDLLLNLMGLRDASWSDTYVYKAEVLDGCRVVRLWIDSNIVPKTEYEGEPPMATVIAERIDSHIEV